MTGAFLTADEALRIGLYNRVVADGDTLAAATTLAEQLARGPAEGLAITKSALDREAAMDLRTALAFEAETQASLMTQADFHEAYDAFVAKRAPRFR